MGPITISNAKPADLSLLSSFYAQVSYSGGVQPDDAVVVARDASGVVGAVRLCREEQHLVLRGMQVAAELRGMGLGRRLLQATVAVIGERDCWCIPHQRLIPFYGTSGFVKATSEVTPDFLVERGARYENAGHRVTVMVRRA